MAVYAIHFFTATDNAFVVISELFSGAARPVQPDFHGGRLPAPLDRRRRQRAHQEQGLLHQLPRQLGILLPNVNQMTNFMQNAVIS